VSTPARRPRKGPTIHRIDGARHWRSALDQYLTLLQLANITPAQILKATKVSLSKRRKPRPLVVPTIEAMEYSRILTHWQEVPKYLDDHGKARDLSLQDGGLTFATLVKDALPGTDPMDVLKVLERHHLIKRTAQGRIRMLARAFLPKGEQQGHFLGYTLSAIEGILDTCYSNMMTRNPKLRVGRLQRMVIAERFDFAHLPDYDRFSRDAAAILLAKQDEWLKRREVGATRKKRKVGYVGIGIFGFRARSNSRKR
jgi:hypothetical protein